MLGESGDKPRTGIDFVNPRLEVKADASENGKGVPPNMLMIMTFTGRASSSANDGPAKSAATRTLAPASKCLVIDRTVSNILWLCMEGPPPRCRYLRCRVVAPRIAARKRASV